MNMNNSNPIRKSSIVIWLSTLIIFLVPIATISGLFWEDAGSSFVFRTLRGDTVQIYGHGLYRYDTTLTAIGFKAGDAVTLLLAIPALLFSLFHYRRNSLRGGLLLTGTLTYLLYVYGSMSFGAAYNNLFLVYLALFSASLFGVIFALTSFDLKALPNHFSPLLSYRGIGIYLAVSGAILILIWLALSILPALLVGKAPSEVWSYTTIITFVIDMAAVAPALMISGLMVLRRTALGYLLASILLVFTALLGANLLAGGILQMLMGLMSIGQFTGFVVSFAILTIFAIGFTRILFRNISD
jgi:hypothetical protein